MGARTQAAHEGKKDMTFEQWAKSHMVKNDFCVDENDSEYISFWDSHAMDSTWDGHLMTMEYIFKHFNNYKYRDFEEYCEKMFIDNSCPSNDRARVVFYDARELTKEREGAD